MANFTEAGCYQSVNKKIISVSALLILSLAGLFTGTFIVAVNVTDWLKQRTMTATNQIITSLGLSRILLHIFFIIDVFFHECSVDLKDMVYVYLLICGTTESTSIWLSVLLSFFFCFKISTFRNSFVLGLKTILSQRVTFLIMASVLLSFGYTIVENLICVLPCSGNSREDGTLCNKQTKQICNIFYAPLNIFPLLVFFVSSVLLIISLGFHLSKMKTRSNVMGNTGSYYKTITYTVVSFLTCAFYITVDEIMFYDLEIHIPIFSYSIFLVLHSVSLIYATTKLKTQFLRVIHCGAECLLSRKAPEPDSRVQVEMIQI